MVETYISTSYIFEYLKYLLILFGIADFVYILIVLPKELIASLLIALPLGSLLFFLFV